jgi:hypothetical protein
MLGVNKLTSDVQFDLINNGTPILYNNRVTAVHVGEVNVREKVALALEADRRETVVRRGVLDHLTLNHTGKVSVALV